MNPDRFEREMEDLQLRARRGDQHAVRELEARLSPALRRIVRRVLRLNRAETPLERGIIRAARRAAALQPPGAPIGHSALVTALAGRLWEAVVQRGGGGSRPELAAQAGPLSG